MLASDRALGNYLINNKLSRIVLTKRFLIQNINILLLRRDISPVWHGC